MANKTKKEIVRLEKKRINKFGLVLLFIVLVCGIGGGVYYYFKNPDFVKSLFRKEEVLPEIKRDSEGNIVGTGDLVNIEMNDASILKSSAYEIILEKVELSNNGYTLFFNEKLYNHIYERVDIICEGCLAVIGNISAGLVPFHGHADIVSARQRRAVRARFLGNGIGAGHQVGDLHG